MNGAYREKVRECSVPHKNGPGYPSIRSRLVRSDKKYATFSSKPKVLLKVLIPRQRPDNPFAIAACQGVSPSVGTHATNGREVTLMQRSFNFYIPKVTLGTWSTIGPVTAQDSMMTIKPDG